MCDFRFVKVEFTLVFNYYLNNTRTIGEILNNTVQSSHKKT